MSNREKVEWGSDNIFADVGLPDADERLLKAQLVAEIFRLSASKKLTQIQVGKMLGISQPEVSRMFRGHFREYSVERLFRFLTAFNRDVEIVVRPGRRTRRLGRIRFSAAA